MAIPRNKWHFSGIIYLENTDWGLPPIDDERAKALGDAIATAAVEIKGSRSAEDIDGELQVATRFVDSL